MPFTLNTWKEALKTRLPGWKARLQRTGVKSTYAFLSAAALWPVVEAARGGEWAALAALGTVTAGLGSNLLANQIQGWKDESDAVQQLEVELAENPDLRAELDAVLEKLEALPQAEQALSAADKAWFSATIKGELAQLGSRVSYSATVIGGGASAQGNGAVAVGEGGTYVAGDYHAAPEARDTDQDATQDGLKRYLERLKRDCQILPLAAIGGEETTEEDITLDQVYIDLNTRRDLKKEDLQAIREGKITRWSELSEDEETSERMGGRDDRVPLPMLEAILLSPKAVILGDPGAGKSTFAKKVLEMQAAAALGAGEPIPHIPADLLPVLVILRELSPALRALDLGEIPTHKHGEKLLQILRSHLEQEWHRLSRGAAPQPLWDALENGRVLLVLDGLDEVPQDLRHSVRQMAAGMQKAYHLERLIVTSRVRSYTGEAVFQELPAFTLRPFSNEQIEHFVSGWYNAQTEMGRFAENKAQARADDLRRAVRSEDLNELAANPMMLTTMAIIHQNETGLPKERVRLYDLAVDVLTRRWQKWKAVEKGLTPSDALRAFLQDTTRLRPALERLAYAAHRNGSGEQDAADLPRGDALVILEKKSTPAIPV